MGLFTNSLEDIDKKVKKQFNDDKSYLVTIKHNQPIKGLAKLLLSSFYYVMDSNRTFILYFDPKGIYESEISGSDRKDFLFMAWHEIEDFKIIDKTKKIIKINHLGKVLEYEIPFDGKIFKNNIANINHLEKNDYFREE